MTFIDANKWILTSKTYTTYTTEWRRDSVAVSYVIASYLALLVGYTIFSISASDKRASLDTLVRDFTPLFFYIYFFIFFVIFFFVFVPIFLKFFSFNSFFFYSGSSLFFFCFLYLYNYLFLVYNSNFVVNKIASKIGN
jgi:hypothetical protein